MIKERYNNFGPNYFRTKEFFRKFKKGQKDSTITKLKDNQGIPHQDPEGILKVGKGLYSNLYKKTTD